MHHGGFFKLLNIVITLTKLGILANKINPA